MKLKAIYPKVSLDMFVVQGTWACGFLGVMILIQIVKGFFSPINNVDLGTFIMSAFVAAQIFMLVIGIIATYGFLPHYVGNGITRKDIFRGASLGAIGLSIALPIISYIIWMIEKGIMNLLNLPVKNLSVDITDIDSDKNLIGQFFQTLFVPVVNETTNFILLLIVFAVSLLTYYLVGWVIGSAFYKNTLLGFVGIAIGIVVLYGKSSILAKMLNSPVTTILSDLELSNVLLSIIFIVLLAISFYLVRVLTKKVVVKI